MKNRTAVVAGMALASFACANAHVPASSLSFSPVKATDRTLVFSTSDEGRSLPILWGLDTAWPSEENMRRGVSYMGAGIIGVVRVSFQPWDYLPDSWTLTPRLEANLQERLRLVSLAGGPERVRLALNNDAPGDVYDSRYFGAADNPEACKAYCNLIYGTMKFCQDQGWTVVSASPLNEPDYVWNNQGSKADFLAIARMLREDYPGFSDGSVRISGGNTLNCDEALPWYEYLSEYIDEGNTHQLAGDFDNYADFFTRVREDGKYATADELHNVMEAIVGVEYGMQTGIWWGTAELARGEFCKASGGHRLAYSENRKAWSAASVYRAPDGRVQAFCGTSERQAKPSGFRFVSTDRDVFYDGHGPCREYVVELPGGDGYQQGQTNAECVVEIGWGEDVRPVVDGKYQIMNAASGMLLAYGGEAANFAPILQTGEFSGKAVWNVTPVPATIGGDFSYCSVTLGENPDMKLDVNNWTLEPGGSIILYNGGMGGNEQWYLEYKGDGFFRIRSRHSNLCLEATGAADGSAVCQMEPSDSRSQLWRFQTPGVDRDMTAPAPPLSLVAEAMPASVRLAWDAAASDDTESYIVLRAGKDDSGFSIVGRDVKGEEFIDNTVRQGGEYRYKVKSVDRSGNTSVGCEEAVVRMERTPAMVAYLSFDGDDCSDRSPNAFDGYSSENGLFVAGHREGSRALHISGPFYLQLPYRAVHSDELTLSVWLRWQGGDGQRLFAFGNDDDNCFYLSPLENGTARLSWSHGGDSGELTFASPETKKWTHLAVVVRPGLMSVYVDGECVGEAKSGGFSMTGLSPVLNYFGCGLDKVSGKLRGTVDDLSIYNYSLTQEQIRAVMENPDSGVDRTEMSDDVVTGREYYTLSGARVVTPAKGLYIVVERLENGGIRVRKEIF